MRGLFLVLALAGCAAVQPLVNPVDAILAEAVAAARGPAAEQQAALARAEKELMRAGGANPTDRLRLASGATVPFTESYRLCGQCHGDKYRDWRAGIHGRRTGHWEGPRTYYLCVHCHNPHSPRFKAIKPEPAPKRPQEIKR